MPSPDLLEAAGRRAAFRPVPTPPSIDELASEVGRRRTKKRQIVGALAAAVALVVAIPLGASIISAEEPDVVTLASDGEAPDPPDQIGQAPVAVEPAETSSTTTSSTTTTVVVDNNRAPIITADGENFDLALEFGDVPFAIEVIGGEGASESAAAAAADADRTRTLDDVTVWIDEQGDQVTASALIDDSFVAVTGPADEVERILDLVTQLDVADSFDRFAFPDEMFDGDFPFDMDEFFEDGEWPGVDQESIDELRKEFEAFSECMQLEFDLEDDPRTIEIPDCEFPGIDGMFGPNLDELFDGRFDLDLEFDFDDDDDELSES